MLLCIYVTTKQKSVIVVGQLFSSQNWSKSSTVCRTCLFASKHHFYCSATGSRHIRNFKHYYRCRMLQKVLITIDSNETMTATEVAHSLSVLDAINFMSASWNSVSAETIRDCFFLWSNSRRTRWAFSRVFTERNSAQFHRWTLWRIFKHWRWTSSNRLSKWCWNMWRSHAEQTRWQDNTTENPTEGVTGLPPKNKEVLAALDTIRQQFQFQEMESYFKVEKHMLDSMSKHVK